MSWPMRPATPPLNRAHIAIGLTVSLLLHVILAVWSWQHKVSSLHFSENRTIAVQLLTPPPRIEPAKVLPPEPVKPRNVARTTPNAKPRTEPRAVVTVPNRNPPDKTVPTAPANPEAQTEKHLDMNAIYGSVKSTMAQIDRENAETPVGQLAAKPLYPHDDNKLGTMINGTTRGDCKEQVQGMGLFAPVGVLLTLLDKKDSGCKWR